MLRFIFRVSLERYIIGLMDLALPLVGAVLEVLQVAEHAEAPRFCVLPRHCPD